MSEKMEAHKDTIRSVYSAYIEGRKDRVAEVLTESFTFSSPQDDRIDRETYFQRCWPQERVFKSIDIELLLVDGNEALVRYRVTKLDGGQFRNVENFRFEGDKIAAVDVYFGRNL